MYLYKDHFEALYESEEKKFNGIITHLRFLTGKNPAINGTVKIFSPTKTHFEFPLQNLFEYGDMINKSFWNFASCNPLPNENWLLFDFQKNHSVSITAYTIRSGGSSHPKSWIFEGSNDKITWTNIDEVHDCTYLNSPRATHTFTIKEKNKKDQQDLGFRFIRFIQLENMSPQNEKKYRINLKALEFFGHYFTVE